jgi:RNase H-fold protein (predicted Holliday junction resolvase)
VKRFLRHIVFFVFPLLILAVVMEFVAEAIPNSYTYKRDYLEQYAAEIQTLILGSSNAYDGLNPSVLPHAFNMANSSQTLEDDYRLLAKYIDSMDSLQTVIVGLGYHSLGATTEDNRRTYYTIYMDLYPRWPISKYSFEVCYPEMLIKKIIKYAVSRDVTRCDSLGQRVGHTLEAAQSGAEWWNKDVLSLVENDRMVVGKWSMVIEENIRYLQAIVELCNAHGVQPVIVQMPVKKEYKRLLTEEQVGLYEEVLQSLDSSVVCVDASEWDIPEDGWYNATHLTKEASIDFTNKLHEEVNNRLCYSIQ